MTIQIKDLFSQVELKKFKHLKKEQDNILEKEINCVLKDLKNKDIDMLKIENNFEYRVICEKVFNYKGMEYIADELTKILGNFLKVYDKKIKKVDKESIKKLKRFLTGLGYVPEASFEMETSFEDKNNISYRLEEGLYKEFYIEFKGEDIRILKIEVGEIKYIEYVENETKKRADFIIKIEPDKIVEFTDKINIFTNKENYDYTIKCNYDYSKRIDEEDQWIYDYLKNRNGREVFEKNFNEELKKRLLFLKEYKYLEMYNMATKMNEKYGVSRFEIFEFLIDENIPLNISQIEMNKQTMLNQMEHLMKSILRKFYLGKKIGWNGIIGFVKKNINENGEIKNNNVKKNKEYIQFRMKIIDCINNGNKSYKDKKGNFKLIEGNVDKYLKSVKIPEEFIYFIACNLEKFNLDSQIENGIKKKVRNLLINEIQYTIDKKILSELAEKVFEKKILDYRFVKNKIKLLQEMTFNFEKETIIVKNNLYESKYIINGFFYAGMRNYMFLPYGENEISIPNSIGKPIIKENKNFSINFDFMEKEIIENYDRDIYRIIIFNKLYRHLKDIRYRETKLEDELEVFLLKQENDFNRIYTEVKKKDVNRTKRERFYENLEKRDALISIIQSCETGEELFKVVDGYQDIGNEQIRENGLYIEICLLIVDKFTELEFHDLKATIFVEKFTEKTNYVTKKIKGFLEVQYSKGIFTENSKNVMNTIKCSYEDFEFDNQLLNLKIFREEFDGEFRTLVLDISNKEGMTEQITSGVYRSVGINVMKEFLDIYIEIYKRNKDVRILNAVLMVLNEDSVYKNNVFKYIEDKLVGNSIEDLENELEKILELYNEKNSFKIKECNLIFKILGRISEKRNSLKELKIENTLEVIGKTHKRYLLENIKIVKRFALRYKAVMKEYVKILQDGNRDLIEYTFEDEDMMICKEYVYHKLSTNLDVRVDVIGVIIEHLYSKKKKAELNEFLKDRYATLNYEKKLCVIEKMSDIYIGMAIELLEGIELINKEEYYKKILNIYENLRLTQNTSYILYVARYLINNNNASMKTAIRILDDIMKIETLEWSEYRHIVQPGIKRLLNYKGQVVETLNYKQIGIEFLNRFIERKDVQFSFIEEYLEVIAIEDLNQQKLIEGYLNHEIDNEKIRKLILKKYCCNLKEKETFIATINRGEITNEIEGLIKVNLEEALKEGFEKAYYYVDDMINSPKLIKNKEFEVLGKHLINFEKARYINIQELNNEKIYGGYLNNNIVKIKGNESVDLVEFQNIFTDEKEQFYKVKNEKLDSIIQNYLKKQGIRQVQRMDCNKIIKEDSTLKGREKDLKILENAKAFIEFIIKLKENKFVLDSIANNLDISENIFFLKDISQIRNVNKINLRYNLISIIEQTQNVVEETRIKSNLKKLISNIDEKDLIEKMKVLIQALKLDLEKDSLVKIIRYLEYLEDGKSIVLKRIIDDKNRSERLVEIVLENSIYLDKDEKTLEYLLEVLYWKDLKNFPKEKVRKIVRFITSEFKQDVIRKLDISLIERTARRVKEKDTRLGTRLEEELKILINK